MKFAHPICTKEVGALHLTKLQLEFGLRIVSDADFFNDGLSNIVANMLLEFYFYIFFGFHELFDNFA